MSQTAWEIEKDESIGGFHAVAPLENLAVTVVEGWIFTRNVIHVNMLGVGEERENMLVAEIDGVRVYIRPGSIIVTKDDLNL